MRLVLRNEFTWDGVYDITNAAAETQYVIVAEIEEKARTLRLFTKKAFIDAQRDADKKGRDEVGVLTVGNNSMDTMRLTGISNEYGVPVAEVVQKSGLGKAKYSLSLHTRVIGSMVRQYAYSEDQYDVEIKDWFVSGDVYTWDFIIVDKHGKLAESSISDNNLSLEYYEDEDRLKVALMLMSLAALSHDMKEANDPTLKDRFEELFNIKK